MFAANRDHVRERIINDIEYGKIVICDRYIFSAIAYHIPITVIDPRIIKNYCNIIGYFDKKMPVPDVIYIIDGDHLSKRNSIVEIFHHNGTKARQLRDMIYKVVRNYTTRFALLRNKNNLMNNVVSYIINDINQCIA